MKWKITAHDVAMKALGMLLLIAAVLKAHELLTVPVVSRDLWSWRPFLIFQVEFELALGIWLLSGVFKRLAWLAALACFGLFCWVTLYKGLTGAASCGCFGRVHVNPWITLAAVDLPAVVTLSLFRPVGLFMPVLLFLRRGKSIRGIMGSLGDPLVPPLRPWVTVGLALMVLSATTLILDLGEPAKATAKYEVLEPETWVGTTLPILDHIDIGGQLREGTWLIVLYRHDCPDCLRAMPLYEQMADDLEGNEDILQIALIGVSPSEQEEENSSSVCRYGMLDDTKEWFVSTPAACLTVAGRVLVVWRQRTALDLETVVRCVSNSVTN